jgi:hypothetical protein
MGSMTEPAPCSEGGTIPTNGVSGEIRRNDDRCSKSNIGCAAAVDSDDDDDDDGSFQFDKKDVQLSTEAALEFLSNEGTRESSSTEVIIIMNIATIRFQTVNKNSVIIVLYLNATCRVFSLESMHLTLDLTYLLTRSFFFNNVCQPA